MTSKIYYINTVDKTTSWNQPENFDGTFVVIDDATGFTAATKLPTPGGSGSDGDAAVTGTAAAPSPAKGTGETIPEPVKATAAAPETPPAPEPAKAAEEDDNTVVGGEVVDIDLTDPKVADAAVKIQSSFRGFKERKDLKAAEPAAAAQAAATGATPKDDGAATGSAETEEPAPAPTPAPALAPAPAQEEGAAAERKVSK